MSLQLFDLLDHEIPILGRDPHVGPISDSQTLHYEFDGLAQGFEMPLVAAPVRSRLRDPIGRYPVHVSGEIEFRLLTGARRLSL